jgi:hypothetical protein
LRLLGTASRRITAKHIGRGRYPEKFVGNPTRARSLRMRGM